VIAAGVPFGTPGTTNLLRIAQIDWCRASSRSGLRHACRP